MKKILSLCLACALMFSISAPALATAVGQTNSSGSVTVVLDGEPVSINYRLEDNRITYAKIGNDIMSLQGNVVYFNGEAIATITSSPLERFASDIEPRTGWMYNDTCPYGASPSDYDTLFGINSHNITFAEKIIKYSVGAILAVLITIVPFSREVAAEEVFRNAALMIAGLAVGDIKLAQSNNLYSTEYIYSGGIPYTRKNVFFFYSDSEEKNLIDSTTCYSSWA